MRYVVIHKMPEGVTKDDIARGMKDSQNDPNIKGVRSFINLSEGRAVCVLDAPDKNTLGNWFKSKGMAYDSIFQVELEGDRGNLVEQLEEVGVGTDI